MSDERPTIIPMLAYEDVASAISWLERAFGFQELPDQRYTELDGRVSHAELAMGDGRIMLGTPTPLYQGPARHRAGCDAAAAWSTVPWVIDGVQVRVADRDAHLAHARAAGASILGEPSDQPYGRLYRAEDLEGHRWMFIEPPGR
ncbi:MAG: VOC family protein [Chloroflexota bacterium]